MKFKHKITGVILEPHNEMVIAQMKLSEIYEELKEAEDEPKVEEKAEVKETKKKKK